MAQHWVVDLPNREAGEHGGPASRRAINFSNKTVQFFLHRFDKGFDVAPTTLRFELNPTVSEVGHETCDIEFLRHLQNRIPKADALNVAGIVDGFVMHVGHWGAKNGSEAKSVQPAKHPEM
jgi:hypothetical protein